jgi:hypothetical protein
MAPTRWLWVDRDGERVFTFCSVMARLRFPDRFADSAPVAFSAFCPCGGTMPLTRLDADA